MRIGLPVRVKTHPNKPFDVEKYTIKGEYLDDYIVQKEGSKPRAVNKDLVRLWT